MGAQLALVGSLSPLVAKIKVPQLQANLVQSGAKADIDTRNGVVQGVVNRIDPVVKDGAVEVGELLGEQSSARPLQLVEAVIMGQSSANRLYVRQPQRYGQCQCANI